MAHLQKNVPHSPSNIHFNTIQPFNCVSDCQRPVWSENDKIHGTGVKYNSYSWEWKISDNYLTTDDQDYSTI